jgi:hypothetical protein
VLSDAPIVSNIQPIRCISLSYLLDEVSDCLGGHGPLWPARARAEVGVDRFPEGDLLNSPLVPNSLDAGQHGVQQLYRGPLVRPPPAFVFAFAFVFVFAFAFAFWFIVALASFFLLLAGEP